jgi:lipopolysaccharide transport system ATP-binding protein
LSTVIKVEGLSKQYRLGQVGTGSLAHDVNRWVHRIRGREDPYLKIGEENDRTSKGISDYVWALRDINFEVKQGEVLGIIGRNGAGKSTLLKILSKTTTPTTGQIKIKGRIASLLEVGTGFHPDLSGRDNIFLNGAILGMTKQEIKSKFDEIVDFAGVERYIDTPVKRYSSGMYVRLAFGVAAHLEPEILIVDEVLAVGDAEFQKKALGKMKNVSEKDGRTVLFVSHNMGAIQQLCSHALLLENGSVKDYNITKEVIDKYIIGSASQNNIYEYTEEFPKDNFIKKVATVNDNRLQQDQFKFSENCSLEVDIQISDFDFNILISVTIQDINGYFISTSVKHLTELNFRKAGHKKILITFPKSLFAPNTYCFRIALFKNNQVYDLIEQVCPIKIIDNGTPMSNFEGIDYGKVISNIEFNLLEDEK